MASYIFTILALAWLVSQWINSQRLFEKVTGIVTVIVIIIAFIYWMPIYLGLPLSDLGFKLRIPFLNWI